MSHFRTLLRAAALAALCAPLPAQVATSWFQSAGSPASRDDRPSGLVVDPDGGAYVSFQSVSALSPLVQDAALLRYAPSGSIAWTRTIDVAGGIDAVQALALDPTSGDVVVAGSAQPTGFGPSDVLVARYAPDGTQRFQLTWDGPAGSGDYAALCAVDAAGVAYVVGQTTRAPLAVDAFVLAVDAVGTLLWTTIVPQTGPSWGALQGLALDPAGDLLVAGFDVTAAGAQDLLVLKLAASGGVLWQYGLDGGAGGFDGAFDVATDAAGRVFLAGQTTLAGPALHALVVALDPTGSELWRRTLAGSSTSGNVFRQIEVDPLGDVLVAGSLGGSATRLDAVLAKYDGQGSLLWQRVHAGAGQWDESFSGLALDAAGGSVAVGASSLRLPHVVFESDPLVVRYDRDGTLRWTRSGLFALENDEVATRVAFGPGGGVVYTGWVNATLGAQLDLLTVGLKEQALRTCLGDGSALACPCANESPSVEQEGCLSSLGRGAALVDLGDASLHADTLVLSVDGLPNSVALFVQSSQLQAPQLLGDGISCIGASPFRLAAKAVAGGVARYPEAGDEPLSLRGNVFVPRDLPYQVWYRNAASFCTPSALNSSNGLLVSWRP